MNTLSGTSELNLNFLYWGFVLATALLGVTIIQVFIYFKHYDDKKPLKYLVLTLFFLDILSSALTAQVVHYYMIGNYGNNIALTSAPPGTFLAEWLTAAIVAFLTQMFYASQIYKLRKHSHRCTVPFVAMIFFSVFAFLANVVATALIIALNYFNAMFSLTILKSFTSIGNIFAAASDIVACYALCSFLASHRSDIGRNRTTLIDTLIFYTVNRGILFCVVQLGNMIAYISAPMMLYWVPFHLCLSKLYVNSLLALLNSRRSLRGTVQDVSRMDFRIEPPPTIALGVQKTRTPAIRPFDFRDLGDNGSVTDDTKLKPGTPRTERKP